MWINSVWVGPVGLNRKLKWASKSINYMDSFINMNWTIPFRERENVLSETGRKGTIYATNQELPRQIHIEASVHSITQDCSSNKTKITIHVLFRRSPYLEKTQSGANASSPLSLTNGAPPRRGSCRRVDLSWRPRTKYSPQYLGFEILMGLGYFLDINLFILV